MMMHVLHCGVAMRTHYLSPLVSLVTTVLRFMVKIY